MAENLWTATPARHLSIIIAEQEQYIADYRARLVHLVEQNNTYADSMQLSALSKASHRAYAADRFLTVVESWKSLTPGDIPVLLNRLSDTLTQLIATSADILTVSTFNNAIRSLRDL
jgi:hypothetical protein